MSKFYLFLNQGTLMALWLCPIAAIWVSVWAYRHLYGRRSVGEFSPSGDPWGLQEARVWVSLFLNAQGSERVLQAVVPSGILLILGPRFALASLLGVVLAVLFVSPLPPRSADGESSESLESEDFFVSIWSRSLGLAAMSFLFLILGPGQAPDSLVACCFGIGWAFLVFESESWGKVPATFAVYCGSLVAAVLAGSLVPAAGLAAATVIERADPDFSTNEVLLDNFRAALMGLPFLIAAVQLCVFAHSWSYARRLQFVDGRAAESRIETVWLALSLTLAAIVLFLSSFRSVLWTVVAVGVLMSLALRRAVGRMSVTTPLEEEAVGVAARAVVGFLVLTVAFSAAHVVAGHFGITLAALVILSSRVPPIPAVGILAMGLSFFGAHVGLGGGVFANLSEPRVFLALVLGAQAALAVQVFGRESRTGVWLLGAAVFLVLVALGSGPRDNATGFLAGATVALGLLASLPVYGLQLPRLVGTALVILAGVQLVIG